MIRILAAVAFAVLIASTGIAPAQTNPGTPAAAPAQTNAAPPAQTPAAPTASPAPAQSQQLLNAGQLDALVAPIALYPDPLIAEILMASTYPLEVVEAQRWAAAHKGLKGAQLKAAAATQSWDESVKSLTATPSVLQMMSDKLDWTQKLGDAVLAQQPEVMDAVQRLRKRAQANKKLASNKQQTVKTEDQAGQEVVSIEPTEPDMLYVPYYNPEVVYGAWPDADYPPYDFGAPDYIGPDLLAAGLAFGGAYALGNWVGGGYGWGGGFNWGGHAIDVNRAFNNNAIVRNWAHDPIHRQGVRYNNPAVAQKFAGARNIGAIGAAGVQSRMDFRGRGGQPNIGAAVGSRPNAVARANGVHPQAINRPANGYRPGVNRPVGGYHPAGVNGQAFNRPGGFHPGGFNGPIGLNRPASVAFPGGANAFGNIMSGNRAMIDSSRGFSSLGGAGFRPGGFGGVPGGGFGGGGFHPGGFGGGGIGGGGFHGGGGFGGGGFHGGGGAFHR